jgi:CelD/BcsL family acetyltransferase involved in cellulose biosynthesis
MVPMPAWDGVLAGFPQHTLFHRACWLRLLAECHRGEPWLARVDEGGNCVAAWPAIALRRGPFRILGSPLPGWNTPFLGPLFADGADVPAILAAVQQRRTLGRVAYQELRVLESAVPVDLAPFGFQRLGHYDTLYLDLARSEEELFAGMKRQCKQQVRKARHERVEVREEPDAAFADEFAAMAAEVFGKWGKRPQFDAGTVRSAWRHLAPSGAIRALSAFRDGRRLSTYVLLQDGHTMYAWLAASWQEARQFSAGSLVQWEAIAAAKRAGLRRYDFVSNSGSAGEFKAAFGGESCRAASHWGRSGSPMVAALKRIYEGFLRFRRGA